MWQFETDPEFQKTLDWIDCFVREEVEPLELVLDNPYDLAHPLFERLVRPLQAEVKQRGLWACHLSPKLGGPGMGQLKLALMSEKFGRARFGPIVFGAQAPDTGNSEILAHYGTEEQKKSYLEPLLANRIVSCFTMTEPQGGADPLGMTTSAMLDGDQWVINGEKWFASNARFASFYIVMAVTDPDAAPHAQMSMFIVPADTPGIEIVKDYGYLGEPDKAHAHLRWTDVRVPADAMLGGRGKAFEVAQVRLSGGRMHHAMRALAQATHCFEQMCERVLSRSTKGELLARKQMVQEKLADSWIQLRQFRLLILETAWLHDRESDWSRLRKNVAAVKVLMPKVLHDIAERALHLHGSLGVTDEAPFADALIHSYTLGLADGPTEVHKVTVAREILKGVEPCATMFPDYLRSHAKARAIAKFGLEAEAGVP
ncbi:MULTISPECIES: acyl-CoA dehydrogenase family protein [Sphingobium]|uniref:acyl-CoA dehydrogenase family protein n=1 Tax=Sphingobium TaxID=165695 RepID=UPI00159BF2BA|nr:MULTISPECIES: acyl-CoA dehydrogenase family protein [unclassified Sphingobium]